MFSSLFLFDSVLGFQFLVMFKTFSHISLLVLLFLRQEMVEQLLSNIFEKDKNESAIVSVIQILLTLFETRRPAYVLFNMFKLTLCRGWSCDSQLNKICHCTP